MVTTGKHYDGTDWSMYQSAYDNGGSWRDLNKLGLSNACINWAIRNGHLKMRTISESAKLAWKIGKQKTERYQTKSFRAKMSKIGGVRINAGRCKSITYTSPIAGVVSLNGTWEHKYALWLDQNNRPWKRNTSHFPYEYDGKTWKYFPDFYLEDENIYVEVKGYETDRDRAKWKAFPHQLRVLKRKELNNDPYNFTLR